MSQDEIRRRKTGDPELDAIAVIMQALEPLDRAAAIRVLQWAEERYGSATGSFQNILSFAAAVSKAANDAGVKQQTFYDALAKNEPSLIPLAAKDLMEESENEREAAPTP